MKRILSIILASVMLFGCLVFGVFAESYINPDESAPIFADVDGKWYTDYVYTVFHKGLMDGTSPKDTWGTEHSTFEPNATLTRAMLSAIIVRFADKVYGTKLTLPEDYNRSFTDVKEGKWYTDYVYVAKVNGIVEGYADGSFRPNKAVTREEAVLMISRMIFNSKITGNSAVYFINDAPEEPFKDESKITIPNAKLYTDALVRMGVLNGDANGYFNPKEKITRAETAKIISVLSEIKAVDTKVIDSDLAELSYEAEENIAKPGDIDKSATAIVKYNTAFCYYGEVDAYYPRGFVEGADSLHISLCMAGFNIVEKGTVAWDFGYIFHDDAATGTYDITVKSFFGEEVFHDVITVTE